MGYSTIRSILAAVLLVGFAAACDEDVAPADLSQAIDQSVPADLTPPPPDLSIIFQTDGMLLNPDGGALCGASTFNYATRFVAGRTCSANTAGGQAGASCNTSADCAEVCCTCAGGTNQYMVALCSDHMCNPTAACFCTDVPAKLKADNTCP